jgi:hypothetical protein
MFKKSMFACIVIVLGVAPSLAATRGSTATAPLTADEVIRNNIAARGGEGAWQKVSAMSMAGRMDVGRGMQVPYVMDMKRGRKVRIEVVFGGQTAVQVYDGTNGWKRRPFLGHSDAEPFTADEKRKASMDSDIDGLLVDYAAKDTKATLEGMEKVEGRDTYKLTLTLKNGETRHVWIDAEGFLEAKVDGTRLMDGKIKTVSTYYRDYHTVDGLRIPYVYETSVDGVKTSGKIEVEKVRVNPVLDDSLFTELK